MPPVSKAGLFNISGPYAVGKDSVLNHLLKVYPDLIHRVRTMTTRPVSVGDDPSYTHARPGGLPSDRRRRRLALQRATVRIDRLRHQPGRDPGGDRPGPGLRAQHLSRVGRGRRTPPGLRRPVVLGRAAAPGRQPGCPAGGVAGPVARPQPGLGRGLGTAPAAPVRCLGVHRREPDRSGGRGQHAGVRHGADQRRPRPHRGDRNRTVRSPLPELRRGPS